MNRENKRNKQTYLSIPDTGLKIDRRGKRKSNKRGEKKTGGAHDGGETDAGREGKIEGKMVTGRRQLREKDGKYSREEEARGSFVSARGKKMGRGMRRKKMGGRDKGDKGKRDRRMENFAGIATE